MDSPFTPKRSATETIQFRILCPSAKTGAVIGRGGSSVRLIQSLTSAKVRLLDDPHNPPCDDRIILISSSLSHSHFSSKPPLPDDTPVPPPLVEEVREGEEHPNPNAGTTNESKGDEGESSEVELSPAQKALERVFEKVVKGDSEEDPGEGVVVMFKVVVGSHQVGSVLGRGGKVLEKIRTDSGAQLRFLPRDHIPACASPGDELIQITGDFSAVKKALLFLSCCLQDNPRAEAMPTQMDLSQRGYPPGHHAPDYHPRGYAPNMGPENFGPHNRMFIEEEVVFKLLCQADKVGSLIGKGGNVVRALQNETGASIKIADTLPDSNERIVVISARENSEQRHSPAQDAVIRVHSRIVEIGFERGSSIVARLLVQPQQIGRLLGKGGQVISEMRQLTGANIRIFPKEQAPKYGFQNEEVVQVVGNMQSVQDALFHITSRMREIIFPVKPPFSSPNGPPYPPPPFPEMHPPHYRPRPNPASPGRPYPSPVGPFPGVDRSAIPPHPHDHQPPFSYGMDYIGPPNLERGPYPYSGERVGHGPQFESSPRSWTPQPFSNGNPRGGADVGSGMTARHGSRGSGGQASDLASTPVEVGIPQKLLSHVYGENNSNLNHIRHISGANVLVHDPKPGASEGLVVVSGTLDQTYAAQSLIHAFILCGETTT